MPALRARRLAFVPVAGFAAVLFACGGSSPDQPAVLVLGTDTIVLAPGARITDVHVRTASGERELQPQSLDAMPGDVLRFSSEDGGPHALVFDDRLTDEVAMDYLRATFQLRGLPLVETGSAWVVSLVGAPEGGYAVRCLTHGGVARIRVVSTGRAP